MSHVHFRAAAEQWIGVDMLLKCAAAVFSLLGDCSSHVTDGLTNIKTRYKSFNVLYRTTSLCVQESETSTRSRTIDDVYEVCTMRLVCCVRTLS